MILGEQLGSLTILRLLVEMAGVPVVRLAGGRPELRVLRLLQMSIT